MDRAAGEATACSLIVAAAGAAAIAPVVAGPRGRQLTGVALAVAALTGVALTVAALTGIALTAAALTGIALTVVALTGVALMRRALAGVMPICVALAGLPVMNVTVRRAGASTTCVPCILAA